MSAHPLIQEYVTELRSIAAATSDESQIFDRLAPFAKRLSINKSWVEERFMRPDAETEFSAFPLHEEPDHSLAVLAVSWVPGKGVEPHDHGTWAVIVGVEGVERNVRYERLNDGSKTDFAEPSKKSEVVAGPSDIVCIRSGGIHEVRNDGETVARSLHTYGMHTNHTTRYLFDVKEQTASSFEVAMN